MELLPFGCTMLPSKAQEYILGRTRGAQVMLVGILLMVVPVAAGGTGGQEVSTTSTLSYR